MVDEDGGDGWHCCGGRGVATGTEWGNYERCWMVVVGPSAETDWGNYERCWMMGVSGVGTGTDWGNDERCWMNVVAG